ncbi:MAG TPA: alpha/beta hydrolase [Mycobacteriales bacterium]|nr:alpha/beta hydrolase [Mycobacteriales bacterium]
MPLNYARPHGRQITLELSRVSHASGHPDKGPILVNPGGPGASGLGLAAQLAAAVPGGVGRDYDWIGWDPRGVGASRPQVHCTAGYFAGPRRSYVPTSHRLLHYWKARARRYAYSCGRDKPLLRHLTTVDSARDMESIRRALGASKISFYGYSYGSYLGQVYSTLYPRHLKRMVLDSNVDPRRVWYDANLDQDRAFDRTIAYYFRWVARHHDVWHLGSTTKHVRHRYYHDLGRLRRHPRGQLGSDEYADAFQQAAYYQSTWETLTAAWRALDHGRPAAMRQQWIAADRPYSANNDFAVYNAVQCADAPWPKRWSTWQRDNERMYRAHPFLTWGNAWINAPCHYWLVPPRRPITINGKHTRSALLIDETLDAATPYEGSLEVRRLYPHSRLIAEPGGTTHADSLNGDRCVDDKIAAYLKSGTLPKRRAGNRADATCRPLPQPNPKADGY